MAIKTLYHIKPIISIFFFRKKMLLNFNDNAVERIAILGVLVPKIFIIIKEIINTLYKVTYFIIVCLAHIIIIGAVFI